MELLIPMQAGLFENLPQVATIEYYFFSDGIIEKDITINPLGKWHMVDAAGRKLEQRSGLHYDEVEHLYVLDKQSYQGVTEKEFNVKLNHYSNDDFNFTTVNGDHSVYGYCKYKDLPYIEFDPEVCGGPLDLDNVDELIEKLKERL